MSKKPPGRPSKLTDELQRTIVEALRAGNYRETTAAFAGIAVSTLYHWLERGEAERADEDDARIAAEAEGHEYVLPEDRPFAEFSEACTRAEAEAEVHAVATLRKHMSQDAEGDWRAAVEYLRRRYTRRWSATERLEVEGDHTVHGGVPVEIVPGEEQRAEVARLLASVNGDGSE
jgi:transposase